MTQDDRMETITDPAEIRASDEPDERTTPAPVGAAVALDLDRIADGARMGFKATPDLTAALVAEVRRLAGIEAHRDNLAAMIRRLSEFLDGRGLESWKHGACWAAEDAIKTLIARAESAEAEVVTLRAKVAAVEAWPLTLEQVHAIVDYLLGDGSRDGLIHGDTLNRAMGASARRRAALAGTTGEGQ